VGKTAEKAVCRSVFLTAWHCLAHFECRINKNLLLQTVFFFGDFAHWVYGQLGQPTSLISLVRRSNPVQPA